MAQGHEDDLFSPSLAETRRERLPAGRRPWRLGSQFYVSVLGGPLAAGLVGFLNGQRLGLPRTRLAAISAIALAALAAVAVTLAAVSPEDDSPVRLVSMVGGAAAYVAIRALQTDADRRYTAARGGVESYDSLWLPGLGIVVAGGILAGIVILGVTE